MLLFGSLKYESEESTIIDRKGYGMVYDYIRRLFMESEPLLLFAQYHGRNHFESEDHLLDCTNLLSLNGNNAGSLSLTRKAYTAFYRTRTSATFIMTHVRL